MDTLSRLPDKFRQGPYNALIAALAKPKKRQDGDDDDDKADDVDDAVHEITFEWFI